jgi:hypothetical protein
VALRNYSSTAAKATLTLPVSNSATQLPVSTTTGWPSVPFTAVIDRGLAAEEVVTVTALAGLFATVTRHEDGTSGVAHAAGATVEHGVSARDFSDANTHVNATTGVHGTVGALLDTASAQTLDNKTFQSASGSNAPLKVLAKAGQASDILQVKDQYGATALSVDGYGELYVRSQTPGTTGARPATAIAGTLRWNTTTSKLEAFIGGSWIPASAATPPPTLTQLTNIAHPAGVGAKVVAYGASLYVSLPTASGNLAYSSPDGVTWTSRTLPATQAWNYLAFVNGRFIALGGTTTGATSTDGITWTAVTLPTTTGWNAVSYASGLYVILSTGLTNCYSSPDLITWTSRTLPATGSPTGWVHLASSGTKFVAASNLTGYFATSPDGITWTSRNHTALIASGSVSGLVYGNSKFVAISSTGLGNNAIVSTDDGVNFTSWQMAHAGMSGVGGIYFGNGVFVVSSNGGSATTSPQGFNVSSDGNYWTFIRGPFGGNAQLSLQTQLVYGTQWLMGHAFGGVQVSP